MKARITLSVVLVLMLTLVSAVSVSADGSTSQMTMKLNNDTPVSSTLIGNHAGAYWYASLDNSGNGAVVTIDMTLAPADPDMVKGVGFNLYSSTNGQLIGSGLLISTGLMELQYTSNTTEPLLLQVFNYIDNAQVSFTITATGLTAIPVAATGSVSPVSTPEAPVASAMSAMSGTLVGDAGGAFTRYWVTFNTTDLVTLDMYYTPADPIINKGVDFMVYGSDGEVDAKVATGVTAHIEATFTPVVGQKYLVQVQNYIQGVPVSYNIENSVNPASVTMAN